MWACSRSTSRLLWRIRELGYQMLLFCKPFPPFLLRSYVLWKRRKGGEETKIC